MICIDIQRYPKISNGANSQMDSFPANPSGAALWHPHAAARAAAAAAVAAAATATVKVAAGGGRLEERLAP